MIPHADKIQEIVNSKDNIAWAIAMSIANGNESIAFDLYKKFRTSILENTTVFFLETEKFESVYELEKKELLKKFSDFLGYDVTGYMNGDFTVIRTTYGNKFKDIDPKILEMYDKNERTYKR